MFLQLGQVRYRLASFPGPKRRRRRKGLVSKFKVQSLIDEAQVSTIHICETSKHTNFEILLQNLNGVVPMKSRVGWFQPFAHALNYLGFNHVLISGRVPLTPSTSHGRLHDVTIFTISNQCRL